MSSLFLIRAYNNALSSLSILVEQVSQAGDEEKFEDYSEMFLVLKEDLENLEESLSESELEMVEKNIYDRADSKR